MHTIFESICQALQPGKSSFHIRAATEQDQEYIYQITKSAMQAYVEQIFGPWIDEEQQAIIAQSFDANTHAIIQVDENPVGVLAIAIKATHIQLEKLFLLPRYHNSGIGGKLYKLIQQEADNLQVPLRLRVLRSNQGPLRFYLRHGLALSEEAPERFFLEYKPHSIQC